MRLHEEINSFRVHFINADPRGTTISPLTTRSGWSLFFLNIKQNESN